ncbi:MAG: hypothetical protein EXR48_01750 [Dehalococcoidia bacterium]|nr:hypothetical protein [Dehalococcoidia bacterium]
MSFLVSLAAEWYAYYHRCAVWTHTKFGPMPASGLTGELEVVAFNPWTRVLTHIETFPVPNTWQEHRLRVAQRFHDSRDFLKDLFALDVVRVDRLAVIAVKEPLTPAGLLEGVDVKTVPALVNLIAVVLAGQHPVDEAVPESYPLLRAMQLGAHYGLLSQHTQD